MSLEVLILSYCHERWIKDAVQSVLSQSYSQHMRITLIDDYSTDKTVDIADRLLVESGKDYKILVNSRRKHPEYSFWWDAIRNSEADYVALLDGDDYWICPEKIEIQISRLESNKQLAISHHDYVITADSTAPISEKKFNSDKRDDLNFDLAEGLSLGSHNSIGTSSVVLRREFVPVMPVGFNNLRISDYPLWALTSDGKLIEKVKFPMSAYRIHQNNVFANLPIETKLYEELVSRTFIMLNIQTDSKKRWREETLRFIRQNFTPLELSSQLTRDLVVLEAEINGLRNSWSWKITSPIRKTLDFLGRAGPLLNKIRRLFSDN